LPGYIAARLARAGVQQIEDIGLCTYAEPERFFSFRRTTHRAEPDYGRHINAIALAGEEGVSRSGPAWRRSGLRLSSSRPEHDPEQWKPVFGHDHTQNKESRP